MNELLCMVVPLDTLAGWPAAKDPTVLQTLGLLVGLPALVIVIAFGIARLGNTIKASRGEAAPVTDAVWVRGADGEAVESAEESDTGGASARW